MDADHPVRFRDISDMAKHHPDYELQLMQRVLRDLAKLTPAGRERALAYWQHRIASMPATPPATHGEQQLDLEADALRPQARGGVVAPLHAASTDTHAHPHTPSGISTKNSAPSEIFGTTPNNSVYTPADTHHGLLPAADFGESRVNTYTHTDAH